MDRGATRPVGSPQQLLIHSCRTLEEWVRPVHPPTPSGSAHSTLSA
jgi:hypothetical protein